MNGTPLIAVHAVNAATDTADTAGTCPRCGGAFHCGASDPAPCACTGLQLSAETLAGLRQRYKGCLCLACLALFASPGLARH